MTNRPSLSGQGGCVCHNEPRGDHGLEGYQRDQIYFYQELFDEKGTYYRVFPTTSSRYETCDVKIFNKYFKVTDNLVRR